MFYITNRKIFNSGIDNNSSFKCSKKYVDIFTGVYCLGIQMQEEKGGKITTI